MFEEYSDLMILEDVCEVLHMSRTGVYSLLKSGELKGFQQGRIWKIPKIAVITYIMKKSGLQNKQ